MSEYVVSGILLVLFVLIGWWDGRQLRKAQEKHQDE